MNAIVTKRPEQDNVPWIDVMLDLETLGVKPGCKILSISAVTFNVGTNTNRRFFDIYLRIDSQPLLETDANTYDWWMGQDPQLKRNLFDNLYAEPLAEALQRFALWIEQLNANVRIWGKGPQFDCSILAYAYRHLGLPVPWDFRNERCYRTLEAQFKHMVDMPEFQGRKHVGLHDATHQANCAELILERIQYLEDFHGK